MDVIDNVEKKIVINCDAADAHLETDVNNFFMAYRFSFEGQNYNKKTGIEKVINTPVESLSVNSGEGVYDNVYLTSVNDYIWGKAD